MRAKKIDGNQNEIVSGLRKRGYSVYVTSMVGNGFPDIVVGVNRVNYLFEIKDESRPPSKRKLTDDEQRFFDTWSGTVHKVESLNDALNIIDKRK